MAQQQRETLNDYLTRMRANYQAMPFSWKANFLQQPPEPWYNNASAQVPPAPAQGGVADPAVPAPGATPAAATGAQGDAGGGGLNQLLSMNPGWGAFGQSKLGGMLNGMLGRARVGPAMGAGQGLLGRLGLGGSFPGGGQGGN